MNGEIRNCKTCVVGGAGFLGSHLVNHLIEDRDCDVLVVDNLCAGRREFVHPRAEFHHADITQSEEHLRQLFKGIDWVFNYAAHPYVPMSFQRPKHVFETNATGAINVINAAHDAGCKGVLQVSSAELYGEGPNGFVDQADAERVGVSSKINENGKVSPHSTYGAAKAAVDYYCQAAWRERQTRVIALRQFNALGERDVLHPYVVTTIIQQLMPQRGMNKVGAVRLGTNTTRDFMYAGDAVKIAVLLLEKGRWGEVFNSGSEEAIKVYDLAHLTGRLMGFDRVDIVYDQSRVRPWDIHHLQSDNGKINKAIGPFQRLPLSESLARTVRWFTEN